jgi:hypothetical protein
MLLKVVEELKAERLLSLAALLTETSWFSAVVIRDSGSNWLSSLSLVKLSPIKVSRVEVTID